MNQSGAITSTVIGSVLVVASFVAKKFNAAGGLSGTTLGREIAPWKGRLLFRAVGGIMILFGLLYFLTDH